MTISELWKRWRLQILIVVALFLGLLLSGGPYAGVPLVMVAGAEALRRWGKSVSTVMRATRLSGKWTGILVVVFGLTPLAAGHGVAPIGLLLCLGWQFSLMTTVLGWLGLASLGMSHWIAPSLARMLALVGACLLAATVVFYQTRTDDALLATLMSLPFLACFVVFVTHLFLIRTPPKAVA